MNIQLIDTELSGVKLIKKSIHKDLRGDFSKTFSSELFGRAELNQNWSETFYSKSKRNVLRGMHYQKRPYDQEKLVSVLNGSILDVIVCIDPSSQEYKHFIEIQISAESAFSVYIGKGYAHGFLALSEEADILYQTSSAHSPEHDMGVNYESFDYKWPKCNTIISERDKALPILGEHEW